MIFQFNVYLLIVNVFYSVFRMRNVGLLLFLITFLLTANKGWSQQVLKGEIVDEMDAGIPFAKIYVKNSPDLRTKADIKGSYLMRLQEGQYNMVFRAPGYETKELFVIVREKENVQNVRLNPVQIKSIEAFDFAAKRKNVGREMIKKTIARKEQINHNQYPSSCDVYIRAKDRTVNTEEEDEEEEENGDARYDDIESLKKQKMKDIANINMVEVELQRNYAPPNNVKELRNAYSKYGNDWNLYYTTTAKSNFDFFQNVLYLNDLSKSPIQSPISTAGIFSYKYQLVEKIERPGKPTLNKIKIEPRNMATSTLEGFIWLQDSTWLVEKIDFTIVKGTLLIYDFFSITQNFKIMGDSLCVLEDQQMEYGMEYRKEKTEGNTVVNYSNYDFNPNFDAHFFGNEVAVTTKEAYERDSLYWKESRLTPLTSNERTYMNKRDSIENLFTKDSYLDSVDSVFNKVTFWKIVWFGIDHRNREKKTQWSLSSLAQTLQPLYIAGPRIGPDFNFYKKWEDETSIDIYARADIGFLNADIKGNTNVQYLYDPFKQAYLGGSFVHNYDLIRSYDALTQVFLRDNFIEKTAGTIFHSFELLNGLYLDNNFTYTNRRSLPEDTKFIRWFDDALDNGEPSEFKSYNALMAQMTIRFVPFQKYMREPNRKVVLGSKWPELFMYYEKGIPKILNSEVDHDYIRFGVRQTFKIGVLGTSKYRVTTGKFLNAKILRPTDYKYHRRADPILFSNPLFSYQGLDSTLPTMNWYFESHYIHHFNGALINKIPFMKRTRISTVAGGGYLWVPEHDWIHYEIYTGLERVFKFAKRRLRIGAYVAFSEGNHTDLKTNFKISFAILDRRSMKFNF